MNCENCGAASKENDKFCNHCGHPLTKEINVSDDSREDGIAFSADAQPDSEMKKKKVPFYISWPFIEALVLLSVYFVFFIPVPCILAVLRILHNKKHPEHKLSRIKNILLVCLTCLLCLSYAGSVSMYADDKKSDKIYAAIDAEDFGLAAELMSEYYGENPVSPVAFSVYYDYYLAQGEYENAADVYLSYLEEYPGDATDIFLGKIDDLSDKLSEDTLARLSAVKKTVAQLQTTTTTQKTEKAEKTTAAENTTKAEKADKTEKTTKAKTEKTTKAETEKTTKAKVEKTTKAETEKTTKAKVEKTTKAEKKNVSYFEKRKIDKHFKKEKFEDTAEFYKELSAAGKEYANGKAEEYICSRLSETNYSKELTAQLYSLVTEFSSAGMSSELLKSAENAITVLNNYKKMHSELPLAYRGPIPSDAQEELLDVYLKQRVEIDGEKRYYVAYTGYNNYYGTILPDGDSEIIIVCSQEPLSEGVNRLYAVRNGTYDTISDRGFEQTHRLFFIYTDEQWDEYNNTACYSEIRKVLNESISEIEENAFASVVKGDAKSADKSVNNAIGIYCNSVLCGSWGDENSMRCFMNISGKNGNFDIEISWSSGSASSTVWNFKGTYDKKTNTIVYKDGTRTETDSSGHNEKQTVVYSDGSGSIYFENNILKWKDNKQSVGDDCIFRKQNYDF